MLNTRRSAASRREGKGIALRLIYQQLIAIMMLLGDGLGMASRLTIDGINHKTMECGTDAGMFLRHIDMLLGGSQASPGDTTPRLKRTRASCVLFPTGDGEASRLHHGISIGMPRGGVSYANDSSPPFIFSRMIFTCGSRHETRRPWR